MKRIFGLASNAFFLGLVSLLNDFSSEMIYSVMPAFLTVVLGAPALFVGFIEGFADALASVTKVFAGRLSDLLARRKKIAVAGYALSVATRSVLVFVTNIWQAFGLRAIDRVGKGAREAPRDALLIESVDRREIGHSFGFQRAMDTAGSVIGPAVALVLLSFFSGNYRLIFIVGFAVGILTLFAFFFVREGRPLEPAPVRPPLSFGHPLKNFSKAFRSYLLAIFLFGLGVMPTSLLLLRSQDVNLGIGGIPGMYLIYSIAFVLFAIPFGRLSDRVGAKRVILGGFIAAVVAFLVMAKADSAVELAFGFVLLGLYSAMTDGVERAYVSRLVSSDDLATGEGFLGASLGIASLISGVIGGILWSALGPLAAFNWSLVFMLIGLYTFIRFMKKANPV